MKLGTNNPLWELVLLLVVSLAIVSAYSFSESELKIPEIVIKKTKVKKALLPEKEKKTKKDSIQPSQLSENDTIIKQVVWVTDTLIKTRSIVHIDTMSKQEARQRIDTTQQRILLIGDSMLEYLRLRLRDYCAHNGHEQKTVIWYSSSTKYFGESDTLAYFINDFQPTYIILVLGANELFVRDIKERRQPYVEHILKQLGNRKYVWVGPPNWKDDTGINEMIISNVGAERFYPSYKLDYRRASDGAHPLKSSAYAWFDSLALWIQTESMYKIRMEKPDKKSRQSTNTTMLKPIRN